MGDYTHMRGTVYLKPELVEILALFFNTAKDDTPEAGNWLTLIPHLLESTIEHIGYKLLCHNNIGHWTPHALSSRSPWDEKVGHCTVYESGKMEFLCGFKNYYNQQEAFVSLLPEIATEWDIEQDYTECLSYRDYTPGEGIAVYRHTDSPEVMEKLCNRVRRAYTSANADAFFKTWKPERKGFYRDIHPETKVHDHQCMVIDSLPDKVLRSDVRLGRNEDVKFFGNTQYPAYPSAKPKTNAQRNAKAKRKQQALSRKKNRK